MTDRPAPLPLSPALELLRSIWGLNHALERVSARLQSELGVTAPQRLVLRIVGRFPGVTPGRLAALLHVDPGTISARLRALEQEGLLVRERDPRDGRRVTLALTARGRTLDAPHPASAEHAVERLLAEGTAEDQAALARQLRRLTALLAETAGDAAPTGARRRRR